MVIADQAALKVAKQELDSIHAGNHPVLASLILMGRSRTCTANADELAQARAALDALLTQEIKEAASRLKDAWKNQDPLNPPLPLPDMLAAILIPA